MHEKNPVTIRRRGLEYRQLIDEVVEADWGHPGWRLFVWGAALLEVSAAGRPPADHLRAANAGPASDTFMSREREPASECGEVLARAVQRARVTLDVLQELEGRLPGQRLFQTLSTDRGWALASRLSEDDRRNVLFVTPAGPVLARLTAGSERRVVVALAREESCQDCRPWTDSSVPPAALTATLLPLPLDAAMHLHRQGHASGGGPWLGVGETQHGYEIVSTSHYGVDGYGHAWLCRELFQRLDDERDNLRHLQELASANLRRALWPLAGQRPSSEPGFYGVTFEHLRGRFAEHAWAFGRVLDSVVPTSSGRFAERSPAFQISVAPGAVSDSARRRRRVLSGLFALRRENGSLESLPRMQERLAPWLARERAGRGLLTRLRYAASGARIPRSLQRTLLQAQPKHRLWLPPAIALAGYGRLSSLRFAADHAPPAPLYAASYPPRVATARDPVGSPTLTLIHHADGKVTASVFGVGRFGSRGAARSLLDHWKTELDSHARQARGSSAAGVASPP